MFRAELAYENKNLSNHHGGGVLVGDHIYGMRRTAVECVRA
jgi:hypothetical protein